MSASSPPETSEFADDAAYAWWRNTHPWGFILSVRARRAPLLHRATCSIVDRDRKRGALTARGSRQICADSKVALREWVRTEEPASSAILERCPKCSP